MSRLDRYERRPRARLKDDGGARRVPFTAWLTALFGGALQPVGWIIFGCTMIFFWVFVYNSDIWSLYLLRGETRTTSAMVTETRRTSMSEGGSDNRPGTPIYAVDFEFRDNRNVRRQGTSYTLGSLHREGQAVTAEYRVADPRASRIEGTRMKPFPAFTVFVVIFPLVGLALALAGLKRGLLRASLLRKGRLAPGRLIDKAPTNTQINGQTVYKLMFAFETDGREHHCVARTHETALLEDEEEEQILYDPDDPSRSYAVDALPARIGVDEQGNLTAPSPGRMAFAVLPPTLAVGAHAAVAFWLMY